MSKTSTAPDEVPIVAPLPPDPPSDVRLSYVPDIPQYDGAAQWCNEHLGVPVTGVTIKKAVRNRALPRTILMGRMYFSSQDLWNWLMSRRGFPADDEAVDR